MSWIITLSYLLLSTLLIYAPCYAAPTEYRPADVQQVIVFEEQASDRAQIFKATEPIIGVSKSGLGRLPALGWNSWNHFNCGINETNFLDTANRLIALGLKDAGYSYVNIDDCWSIRDRRDPHTGYLVPDPDKFPDGISGLAKKIHDMGLKIGIYSSAGTLTCAGYPASLGHEDVDARAFAEWGIDYLKYDNCFAPPEWSDECTYCQNLNSSCKDDGNTKYCPPDYDYSKSKTAQRYNRMRDALNKQDRPILYSLCEWGTADVQSWANDTAQSWRSTGDIENDWEHVLMNLNQNSFYLNHVNFWGHSDPDMLEVGNDKAPGLTHEQERSHFALWAVMKSPLLIGADLTKIKNSSLEILKSKTLLAFNQDDIFGRPATPFNWDWKFDDAHPAQYWVGQFKGGIMILLFNNDHVVQDMEFKWEHIDYLKLGHGYRIVDGWNEDIDYGCFNATGSVTVRRIKPHDTAVLVVKETSSCTQTRASRDLQNGRVAIQTLG